MARWHDENAEAIRIREEVEAAERAKALRINLAKDAARGLRAQASVVLQGAADDTDGPRCEARLAVAQALVKAAAKFERGDLS